MIIFPEIFWKKDVLPQKRFAGKTLVPSDSLCVYRVHHTPLIIHKFSQKKDP
jgi:hypothetical protein